MPKPKTSSIEVFKTLIQALGKTRVLVIGDLMWDEYLFGESSRISPEAPVPVVHIKSKERVPGGATNVLNNLVDLQVPAGIMGVVGADKNGREMIKALNNYNLQMVQIWESPDRPTITKTRVLARNQQLIRLDDEVTSPISKNLETRMLTILKKEIYNYKGIILSDYDKGLLTQTLIQGVIELAHANEVFVAVDPQVSHFKYYSGADIMTPNEKEASLGIGASIAEKEYDVNNIGKQIKSDLNLNNLIITRSHKGMALFEGNKEVVYIPTMAREVYDVSGAGDTVVAVYTAAVTSGCSPLQATLLANIAGGVVVGKLGTATVKRQELLDSIQAAGINLDY